MTDGAKLHSEVTKSVSSIHLIMIIEKAPVTLYVVTHNYTRFLREALESVDAQTWRPNQFIIINNGSTDGVEVVLKDYVRREDITIIHNSNIGHVRAANQALKLATEKYFMRLDGDDILMHRALEYLVNAMESEPEVAYAFGDYITIDENDNLLDYCSGITHKSIAKIQNDELVMPQLGFKTYTTNQLHKEFAPHGAVTLIKSEELRLKGFYDEKVRIGDGDTLKGYFSESLIGYITSPLFYYRRHSSNLTLNSENILY